MRRAGTLHVFVIRSSTVLAGLMLLASPMAAQKGVGIVGATLDTAQRATMMVNALKWQFPAEFVLEHGAEFSLTPEQTGLIQHLVVAEHDSATARQATIFARARAVAASSDSHLAAIQLLSSWTGPVDDAAIRAAICEQATSQADFTIGVIRDRHAVADVLTQAQRALLSEIETNALMRIVKKP
ncbi:MAG: hypothetical protein ABJE10_18900 [bacterium]